MNLNSHLFQRMLHLPPPVTRDLVVEHDLRVPCCWPTAGPRATATTLRAADQQVFHGSERPSAIILPVQQAA
ncbi:hypothetical protein AB0D59_49145 [Streptomyces sp. NPDC048417]|uniref:hypothetical protein n=1 Tax=Streptomyces sp. NPDC048417 TaxID=3155387 RepID=UPI00343080C4